MKMLLISSAFQEFPHRTTTQKALSRAKQFNLTSIIINSSQGNKNMPPNADVLGDVFLQDMEELLHGRYFYTIYYNSKYAHNKIFKRRKMRMCLLIGALLTIIYESMFLFVAAKRGGYYPHAITPQGRSVRVAVQGYIELPPEMNAEEERYSRPSSVGQSMSGISLQEKSQEITNLRANQSIFYLTAQESMLRLLITFCVMTLIAFLIHLTSILFAVCYDVLLRHLVSVHHSSLIWGLIRFRRVAL